VEVGMDVGMDPVQLTVEPGVDRLTGEVDVQVADVSAVATVGSSTVLGAALGADLEGDSVELRSEQGPLLQEAELEPELDSVSQSDNLQSDDDVQAIADLKDADRMAETDSPRFTAVDEVQPADAVPSAGDVLSADAMPKTDSPRFTSVDLASPRFDEAGLETPRFEDSDDDGAFEAGFGLS